MYFIFSPYAYWNPFSLGRRWKHFALKIKTRFCLDIDLLAFQIESGDFSLFEITVFEVSKIILSFQFKGSDSTRFGSFFLSPLFNIFWNLRLRFDANFKYYKSGSFY